MASISTRPWDAAEHLQTQQDVVAYLEAAFEDGDPQLIAAALGDVARSRGMTKIAAQAGLGRESLYKALSTNGNASFATVLKVLLALGITLQPCVKQSDAVTHQFPAGSWPTATSIWVT